LTANMLFTRMVIPAGYEVMEWIREFPQRRKAKPTPAVVPAPPIPVVAVKK